MTKPASTETLELRYAESCDLRVVFEKAGDRWGHAIESLESGEWTRLLESMEGSAASEWPLSPPLQNLHFEDRPDGFRVALAVGMAGRSHWSASIETHPDAAEIRFDIACRTSAPPAFLGVTYRVGGTLLSELVGNEVRLHRGNNSLVVRYEPLQYRCVEPDAFSLAPAALPTKFPATVRWQYAVRLSSSM